MMSTDMMNMDMVNKSMLVAVADPMLRVEKKMSVVEFLTRARDMIKDEIYWCQGQYSKMGGLQHCASGALFAVANPDINIFWVYRDYIGPAIGELYPNESYQELTDLMIRPNKLVYVNDRLGHVAVMKVFDRAIQLAELAELTKNQRGIN